MKLAEALQERAELQKAISLLEERLENNATVQEGEKTAEDPNDLLAELDKAIERLEYVTTKINITNSLVKAEGLTLTEIISRKDCLMKKANVMLRLIRAASRATARATRTEIKILRTVNVADIQKKSDAMAIEIRRLNTLLQQTNWTADLIEN